MRIKAILSYHGKDFFGYQIQTKTNERSVQDEIQKVLSRIFSSEIKIYGSGRTDRGVHALNQCIHFDIERENVDLVKLRHSLNCLLEEDIYIKSLEVVDESFHARFSVIDKTYLYKINVGEFDVFNRHLVFNLNKELDLSLIKEASKKFIGEHSFHNFCANDEDFIRVINDIEITSDNNIVSIKINGNGFRRYMVRMIVGTLIEVGLKHIDVNQIDYYLNEVNSRVSYKAPSEGLYLYDINYGGEHND